MLKSGNFDTWEEMGLCGQWCKEDHCANSVENALRCVMKDCTGTLLMACQASAARTRPRPPHRDTPRRTATHRNPPPLAPFYNHLRFNNLPMNQPYVSQQWSSKDSDGHWRGSFYGTWDPSASPLCLVRQRQTWKGSA